MADNVVSVTVVACLIWVVKTVVGKISPALDRHTKAAIKITDAIREQTLVSKDQVKSNQYVGQALVKQADEEQSLTTAIERMAVATERAAIEAEQRNGHLAEISIQNKDAILEAIRSLSLNQEVKEQNVEHQVIKSKELV